MTMLADKVDLFVMVQLHGCPHHRQCIEIVEKGLGTTEPLKRQQMLYLADQVLLLLYYPKM